ncbi:hypothetical protein LCGC14_3139050, partial [marine sediment metagenome]
MVYCEMGMKNWKKEIAKFDKIIRNNNIIYNHK